MVRLLTFFSVASNVVRCRVLRSSRRFLCTVVGAMTFEPDRYLLASDCFGPGCVGRFVGVVEFANALILQSVLLA